jgi:uncharacterized phiE125 gp8 family phage protein
MIIYSRVTSSPANPITLEETKLHLRVDGTDDNLLIDSLIRVATRLCETYAGLSFITQTRTVKLDYFDKSDVILPYGPVTAVTGVTYIDGDDAPQTVNAADYKLDTQSGLAKIRVTETWPYTNETLNNVVVTYTAGYGAADAVPDVIKHAIKMTVASLYENRGDEKGSIPSGAQDLLDTIKVYWNAEY